MIKKMPVLYVFGFVLVGVLIFAGYRYVSNAHLKEEAPPEVTNLVNTDEVRLPEPEHDTVLEKKITDWAAAKQGVFGVTVREITPPQRYASYRGDEQMIAASTYKLFLIHAILHEVELGRFTLETPVAGGTTIASCVESLLEVSSDACAYAMGNLIGWDAVDGFIAASGFSKTTINNYLSAGGFSNQDKMTTANDQAELVWRLATGKLLNEAHTTLMLDIMKRQIWRERIAAGVPEGVDVATKPGFIYNVQNDTGIVYGKTSTYAVSLLSDGSSASALAELSALIYGHLNPQ